MIQFILQDCLSPLSMQALPEPPESLCIVEMGGTEAKEETGEVGSVGGLFLNIGLQVCKGVLFGEKKVVNSLKILLDNISY